MKNALVGLARQMNDGIVVEKNHISSTKDLYDCELKELPIDREYEIKKHEEQIIKAKALSEKLYDKGRVIRNRTIRVNNAINWNQLMLDNLRRGG